MPDYDIAQYVLYTLKYRVNAGSAAEAIWRVLDEQVDHIEDTLEYMEVAESYGLPAEDYPELCRELATFDIPVNDVLPSICRIQEVLPEPTDAPRVPSLCVILESEPHGRECFDHYSDLDEMLAAVKRMVRSSLETTSDDGIARTVGIAIVPPADPEDSEDAPDHHSPG